MAVEFHARPDHPGRAETNRNAGRRQGDQEGNCGGSGRGGMAGGKGIHPIRNAGTVHAIGKMRQRPWASDGESEGIIQQPGAARRQQTGEGRALPLRPMKQGPAQPQGNNKDQCPRRIVAPITERLRRGGGFRPGPARLEVEKKIVVEAKQKKGDQANNDQAERQPKRVTTKKTPGALKQAARLRAPFIPKRFFYRLNHGLTDYCGCREQAGQGNESGQDPNLKGNGCRQPGVCANHSFGNPSTSPSAFPSLRSGLTAKKDGHYNYFSKSGT
jgi:hypothetical protein